MKRIHLLLVIDSLRKGGAEKQFVQLTNSLDRKKFKVSVCLTTDKGVLLEDLEKNNLHTFHSFTKKKPRDIFSLAFQLKKLITELKPDIVHTWLPYSNLLHALALGSRSYRTITGVRVSPKMYQGKGWKKQLIKKWTFDWPNQKSNLILANSRNVLNELKAQSYLLEKLAYVGNGIDQKELQKRAQVKSTCPWEKNKSELILLSAGRLEKQKGFTYLLEAMTKLPHKLYLVGEGSQRPLLEAQIKQNKLENHVHLLGFRSDLAFLIDQADIFILPSLYEGMPNVIMEAMVLKKTIIATAVDGTEELIENDKEGILVPPMNPEALALAIKELAQDSEKRKELGEKAQEKIARFDVKFICQEYERVYQETFAVR